MKKRLAFLLVLTIVLGLIISGCTGNTKTDTTEEIKQEEEKTEEKIETDESSEEKTEDDTDSVVDDDKKLTTDMATGISVGDYEPAKDEYYFAYTYKLIHPWYDAIKVGIDAAVDEYAKQGITIKYDYTAPVTADAVEQINMIESAAAKNPDVIGIDVNQVDLTVPIISELTARDVKVLTFSGGDAVDSERIAFIGNTDNKGDGAKLAEILAESIGYEGEVACLDGTIGASSHEERIEGFNEVMEKYPDITVVDRQRDDDDLEKAVQLTEAFIQKHPNLKGIWCNNMTNPIGAAQAVVDAGKKGEIIIVGMDHDLRTLEYVEDGTILAAQVQNNYDMGFYLVTTSIKAADGATVGDGIEEERFNVGSTSVYQAEARKYIDLLYGEE